MATVLVPRMAMRVDVSPQGSATKHVTMAAANPFERQVVNVRRSNTPVPRGAMPGMGEFSFENLLSNTTNKLVDVGTGALADRLIRPAVQPQTQIIPFAVPQVASAPAPTPMAPATAPMQTLPMTQPQPLIIQAPAPQMPAQPASGGNGLLIAGGIAAVAVVGLIAVLALRGKG